MFFIKSKWLIPGCANIIRKCEVYRDLPTNQILNPDLFYWLVESHSNFNVRIKFDPYVKFDARLNDDIYYLDLDSDYVSKYIYLRVTDTKVALLFKLTW
jgi:hypothetical protein